MDPCYERHYFLGANSPQGFYSLYENFIDPVSDTALYILKGGPGCGKSSFMKKIAEAMTAAGYNTEQIHCSADPESLDGVYIPALKTAYVDGTSPHVIEPKYPAAMEEYINLGVFYDTQALRQRKAEIIQITQAYKVCYTKAYSCISSAWQVERELYSVLNTDALKATIKKHVKGIISREFKKKAEPGKVSVRFLSAFTYMGNVCRFDTVAALCNRVYVLDNEFGFAPEFLSLLSAAAVQNGYDIILCKSPMEPDKTEHVIIPELSLSYISQTKKHKYTGSPYKHIRLDALADRTLLHANKESIKSGRKLANALYSEGKAALNSAKTLHDKLEAVYNPHVDFDGVYELAEKHIKQLRNMSFFK